ncbi:MULTISPECIES: hypothetical protein [Enterobacter]|uniref:hypothetical protein n=1 Tax=Enterobacter TaxID=547 RepID=UPI00254ED45D|nr:hypothetical protein [Enterobacter sp. MEB024]
MLANLLIPLASFGIVSLFSVFMTPFFISYFNYEGLGVISNTNAALQSLFFIGGALTTVYSRAYSNNESLCSKSSVMAELNNLLSWLSLLSILCCVGIGFYALNKNDTVFWYYSIAFMSCAIIIKSQSYTLIPFSKNKIYVNSLIDSGRTIVRNIICLAIVMFFIKDISANAIAMFVSALVILFVLMFFYPSNKIFIISKVKLNDNMKNSLWVCINQGGAYLFSFADIVMVNVLLGHFLGGVYSLLIQLPLLFKTIGSVAQNSISSFVVKFAVLSKDDTKTVGNVLFKCFLFYSFFIGTAFVLLAQYKYLIFKTWLGEGVNLNILNNFDYICYFMMSVSILSLTNIFLAGWGFFSFPAKMTVLFSVMSLFLVVIYNFFFEDITYIIVFTIIYSFLLLKNIICLLFFYISSKIGVLKFFSLIIFSFLMVLVIFILTTSIRKAVTNEMLSLSISVIILAVLSLPLLKMFRDFKVLLNEKLTP